jgi:hypothetical protein
MCASDPLGSRAAFVSAQPYRQAGWAGVQDPGRRCAEPLDKGQLLRFKRRRSRCRSLTNLRRSRGVAAGGSPSFSAATDVDTAAPSSGRPQRSRGVKPVDRVGVASHDLPGTVFASVRGRDAELEGLDLLAVTQAGRPSLDLEHGDEVAALVPRDLFDVAARPVSGSRGRVVECFGDLLPSARGGAERVGERYVVPGRAQRLPRLRKPSGELVEGSVLLLEHCLENPCLPLELGMRRSRE